MVFDGLERGNGGPGSNGSSGIGVGVGGERETLNGHHRSGHGGNRNRSNKRKSTRFGDEDFTLSSIDEYDESDWGEVFRACCMRSPKAWRDVAIGIVLVSIFVYFSIYSLVLFGTGAKVLSGCRVGELFATEALDLDPVTGLMIGALATGLIQSSSTTTAIIVTLVGQHLISVEDATYLVMGANVGTTMTNDIVALASIRDPHQLERAFAGATMHDLINIFTVMILLPFEAATGYLEHVTKLIVEGAETNRGKELEGPVEKLVNPVVDRLIKGDSSKIRLVASGTSCDAFYPTECGDDGQCTAYGFVKCKHLDDPDCPDFFRQGADLQQDQVAGGICVFLGLILLYISLLCLTASIQFLLRGFTTRVVYKATNVNGYIAIAFGAGLTMLLQSSSLTTSLLTPFVGIGALRLEQMYPLTLGANIGTTLSSVLAALIVPGLDPLQVALIHMFFNITAVLIWYPIPHMRTIPIYVSKRLGYCARVFPLFPVLYIVFVYFVCPLFFLSLAGLYVNGSPGQLAGAIISTLLLLFLLIGLFYWCKYRAGGTKTEHFVRKYLSWKRSDDTNREPVESPNADVSEYDDEDHPNTRQSDDDSSTSEY